MSNRKRRVYLDSCVLILAASAEEEEVAIRALEELNRDDVDFVFSSLVELEVFPRPYHNGRLAETEFYQGYFSGADRAQCSEREQQAALKMMLGCNGLGIIDSMHLSCAVSAQADEFVTSEGATKPMVQRPPVDLKEITVRTIRV